MPGQQRRGRHGEDFGPVPAGYEPCQRGEPHPVRCLVPYPAGGPARHRVLVPEHEQLSILRPVRAEYQDSQAECPANKQVADLEQHTATITAPWPLAKAQVSRAIDYSSGTSSRANLVDGLERSKPKLRRRTARPPARPSTVHIRPCRHCPFRRTTPAGPAAADGGRGPRYPNPAAAAAQRRLISC